MLVQGKRPWFALRVEVEECFLQCAKALVRSHLWETESWPYLATVPAGAELLRACPTIDQPWKRSPPAWSKASDRASTDRERRHCLGVMRRHAKLAGCW